MFGKVIARGTICCKPDEIDELRDMSSAHVAASRAEPGCIHFDIVQSEFDPCCFLVSEEFIDRAAFEAHTARTRSSDWWTNSQHFPRQIVVQDRPSQEAVDNWTTPNSPNADQTFEGTYVRMERLDPDKHAQDLFSANTSSENWAYLPYGPFGTIEGYKTWLREECTHSDPHFFAITRRDTGQTVGIASYLRINPASGSIEVGHINFSPLLQRHPAATEAMYLMMKWAFESGYRRYEWKCNAANFGSRRAAERLGLSYEGIFRQMMTVKGRNRDTAWFAAIDKEWPHLKTAFETWLSKENFDENGRQKQRLWDLTTPFRVSDDPARLR